MAIRLWDESRTAINAIEMAKNGNYFVGYFQGAPDMYNTKPLLLTWIQVFFLKILGYNILSIRLPSAIAGFLTVCLLLFSGIRISKNIYVGFFSALTLVTSYGYIGQHVTRTGDYDALLVLFTTAYVIFFYLFSEEENNLKRQKYFIFFCIAVAGAGLTKGIAGFLLTPALLFYILLSGKTVSILKIPYVWIGMAGIVFLVGGFYITREYYNPGYWQAVTENELGGRFSKIQVNPHLEKDHLYYIRFLMDYHFTPWIYLIPVGLALTFVDKDSRNKDWVQYLSLNGLVYLIIISASKTKLGWYDAPFIPLGSIIAGYTITIFLKNILGFLKFENRWKVNTSLIIFTFLIYSYNYRRTHMDLLKRTLVWNPEEEKYAGYMEKVVQAGFKNYTVSYNREYNGTFNTAILFEKELLNVHGNRIKVAKSRDLAVGDTVVFCNTDDSAEMLNKSFETKILNEEVCKTAIILAKK